MWPVIIILTIIISTLITIWVVYNKLIAARESIEEALSGIDIQLKKRYELIPELVEIVKGYSKHEAEIFNKVTSLRSSGDVDMVQKEKEDAGGGW